MFNYGKVGQLTWNSSVFADFQFILKKLFYTDSYNQTIRSNALYSFDLPTKFMPINNLILTVFAVS